MKDKVKSRIQEWEMYNFIKNDSNYERDEKWFWQGKCEPVNYLPGFGWLYRDKDGKGCTVLNYPLSDSDSDRDSDSDNDS